MPAGIPSVCRNAHQDGIWPRQLALAQGQPRIADPDGPPRRYRKRRVRSHDPVLPCGLVV